ncbi:hypothetical protein ACFOY2_04860 [Nonomuraea purpurea]|uniref:Uncharacterized protein n=1 Tax=Nonomuraea purpurea TaxID=1849276 RepID=A0ABV8G2T9_9ACTN
MTATQMSPPAAEYRVQFTGMDTLGSERLVTLAQPEIGDAIEDLARIRTHQEDYRLPVDACIWWRTGESPWQPWGDVMTAHSMTTENGTYEVVERLHRPGGAVDLIVAYSKSNGRSRPVYKAYRMEPDGSWKALSGVWVSAEIARRKVPYSRQYAPVVAEWMATFLGGAISNDDTPNDEGDDH